MNIEQISLVPWPLPTFQCFILKWPGHEARADHFQTYINLWRVSSRRWKSLKVKQILCMIPYKFKAFRYHNLYDQEHMSRLKSGEGASGYVTGALGEIHLRKASLYGYCSCTESVVVYALVSTPCLYYNHTTTCHRLSQLTSTRLLVRCNHYIGGCKPGHTRAKPG